MVPSNILTTADAKNAVTRFTSSHGSRMRTLRRNGVSRRSSAFAPARRSRSSSYSSMMTSMMSSTVMTPNS